jgi:predicted hydrocarbon binding protein
MAEIIVVARDQSGLYAKISVALVRAGIEVTNRVVEKIGNELAQYVLSVHSIDDNALLTIEQLRALDGIIEIEATGSHKHTHAPVKDWKVVSEIKRTYPDIVRTVRNFSTSLKDGDADSRLFGIGYEIGVFTNKTDLARTPASVTFACDEFVIPAISDFCFADRVNGNLVISICPFCRDSPAHIHHCSFLHGIISGNFGSFPDWSNIKITEISSVAAGDEQCAFSFNI